MIISSIGYDEQGAFGVMCTPHLAQPEVNGVEQRGAAFGLRVHHALLQILDAVGEAAGELGAFIEAHQEKFVLRVGGLEELHRGEPRLVHFVGHAAAQIKDHADGNGHVFG